MQEQLLQSSLLKIPLYLMLIDANTNNVRMLASASLDLSGFAQSKIKEYTEFKRNTIDLFDPVKNVVAKLDLSISISKVMLNNIP